VLRPITAVIPTLNRPESIERAFLSLAEQTSLPAEIIVIDGSDNLDTKNVLDRLRHSCLSSCRLIWTAAETLGAAAQRNQGCALARQPAILFFDDDIIFGDECLDRLWTGLHLDPRYGGISAMITNQRYHPPGFVSSTMFMLMNGRRESSYAGRVLGPVVNLLPEDRDGLPEVVAVEWLNTTCTLYRREALPIPPFDSVFTGYSLMEDVTLSLRVGRNWKLANARTAQIFHDSQPGLHKSNLRALSCMSLFNRHYIMTQILHRDGFIDYLRLFIWELFQLAITAKNERLLAPFWRILAGRMLAIWRIGTASPVKSSNDVTQK